MSDAEEPGGWFPTLGTVGGGTTPDVEEGILRHLFSGSLVSEHVHRQRVDRARIPVVEDLERLPPSIYDQTKQLLVAQCLIVLSRRGEALV